MPFIRKIFGYRNRDNNSTEKPAKILELLELESKLNSLLEKDSYLPKSEYKDLVSQGRQLIEFLVDLEENGILQQYCKSDYDMVLRFLEKYGSLANDDVFPQVFAGHNERFINDHISVDKAYFDSILKEVDPNILLDDEQRKVVLSDEDYTLVIAGAGAGKTTTIAAKVRYLVERKGVDPKKILIVSFTNKAVNELRDRINKCLKIDCPISTFHSAGYAILNKKEDDVRPLIVDSGFLYKSVDTYLKEVVLKEESMVKNLVLFFGSYFDSPPDTTRRDQYLQNLLKTDTSTMKGNMPGYEDNIYDRRSQNCEFLIPESD